MSQLQVTGEAKIRDIQGPVVANSGVITALDGAASQYVRGDGTLADFPTSTGGGSSVSYYLNSSVSQGTIGGVAYRELSKEPIIGAGTDITISANGYVASYITDANDPDVLSVPGGNFNCEFYFSVNNNTGNPTTYAELYKYDGTTFTLLGSSQAVPESLNQGTTIAPYYFAIPVATAALALTDRLAIRIYVSVDGRVVTLHTENSHLCQVVTTFSKGMVSLNNLTDQSQFITTGTSGTDFNIVSTGDTHTFNLPVASATNTGKLSSTDWSTFNNKLSTATAAATYVPYTGATTNVDLGFFNFDANQINGFKIIAKLDGTNSGSLILRTGTSGYSYGNDSISLISSPTSANTLTIISDISSVTKIAEFGLGSLTATRTFTLPDSSGTIALTSNIPANIVTGTGTTNTLPKFTGTSTVGNSNITDTGSLITLSSNVTTTGSQFVQNGFYLTNANAGATAGYTHMWGADDGIFFGLRNATGGAKFVFQSATSYNYTFPSASGTLALTSDLGAYLPLTGGTLTGALDGTSATFSGLMTGGGTIRATGATGGLSTGSGVEIRNNSGTGEVFVYNRSTSAYLPMRIDGSTLSLNTITSGAITLGGALSGTSATFSGNFGVGTSNPSAYTNLNTITINGTSGSVIDFKTGEVLYGELYSLANEMRVDAVGASGVLKLLTNSTERMRITSGGNLLLGTTSDPGYGRTTASVYAATGGIMQVAGSSTTALFYVFQPNNTAYIGTTTNHDFAVISNNATRLTIASTGAATFSSSVGINGVAASYPLYVRTGTNQRARFVDNGGIFQMAVLNDAESGYSDMSLGNSAIVIKSGGNVGIGTSSPSTKLHISGTAANTVSYVSDTTGYVLNQLGNNGGGLYFGIDSSTASGFANGAYSRHIYSTGAYPLIISTNDTERMRITSGGLVGIGTSSPSNILSIRQFNTSTATVLELTNTSTGSNTTKASQLMFMLTDTVGTVKDSAYVQAVPSSGYVNVQYADLTFATRNGDAYPTERMRITSGGFIKASNNGTYIGSTGAHHEFRNANTNATDNVAIITVLGNTSNNTSNYHYIAVTNAADKMYVYGNGNIVNTNGSYGTLSDATLKENIIDATPKLADILNLKVRNFNLIGDDTKQIGFIAQEFEEIFPSMIHLDGKSGKKAIKTSVLTPMLVKGLQELKAEKDAEIAELKAQIEELKALINK